MRVRSALLIDPRRELRRAAEPELSRHGITVAGEAGYGLEALDLAFAHQPGLILIRVSSPAARPLDLIGRLHDALPDSTIIALAIAPSPSLAARAVAAGAVSCMEEPLTPKTFAAVISAARGHQERRQQPPSLTAGRGGHLISVAGARGGTGKTTLAVNLALAIYQQSGASVALIDGDTALGDVALTLGMEPSKSIADAAGLVDDPDPRNVRQSLDTCSGIWVLPASGRPDPEVPAELFAPVLDRIRHAFDFVVVDTPHAETGAAIATTEAASSVILVTNPTLQCAADAARAIRSFRAMYGPADRRVHLLLNRAGMSGGTKVTEVAREAGAEARWTVAHDSRVLRSVQLGIPVIERYPEIPASRAILEVAAAFAGRARGNAPKPPSSRGRAAFLRVLPRLVSG